MDIPTTITDLCFTIPVQFKIYADFECNLESVASYKGSYSKKDEDHIPCSFAYKPVCAMINLPNQ